MFEINDDIISILASLSSLFFFLWEVALTQKPSGNTYDIVVSLRIYNMRRVSHNEVLEKTIIFTLALVHD